MQYRVKSLIKSDFLNEILKERGIVDLERFKHPTLLDIEPPENFDNIEKASNLLKKHAEANSKIGLIVDCDCDGYTSSAIIYNFLKFYYPELVIDYYLHEGKQHGLEDQVDNLINKGYDLLLVPDAGSNDFSQQQELNAVGTDILILDHHSVDEIDPDWYSNNEHTIIINNQLSENYTNKSLSGAGVTWQFCKYYERVNNLSSGYADRLMDLAALGIIGDCMDMREIENRAFSYYGLNTIYNPFLKLIVTKQQYQLKREDKITPVGVGFYIAPLINSVIRVGSSNEKEKLFEAFVNSEKIVPSTKRGEKGLEEKISVQMVREGTNAKSRQDTVIENAMNRVDMQLQAEDSLENNKIIIAEIDDSFTFPATLNGLVAMKLTNIYKKPVLIVRRDENGLLKGSARNYGKSKLTALRPFLTHSGFFEYAQGHENAFGVCIKDNQVDRFLDYANEELKDMDFGDDFYEVEFATSGTDDTLKDFIYDVYQDDRLWGQQNDAPLIAVTNLALTQDKLQVCGARKDTLRFIYNGVTYIKFFATKDIETLRNAGESFNLTIIGEGAINEWGGTTSPQVIIKDFEIGGTIFDF